MNSLFTHNAYVHLLRASIANYLILNRIVPALASRNPKPKPFQVLIQIYAQKILFSNHQFRMNFQGNLLQTSPSKIS